MLKLKLIILGIFVLAISTTSFGSSKVTFFEIGVSDVARAEVFYGKLFGWTFISTGNSDKFMLISGAGVEGGLVMDATPTSGRANVVLYIEVDDLAITFQTAQALGAKPLLAPTRIKKQLSIAEFIDLDGNKIGLSHTDPEVAHP